MRPDAAIALPQSLRRLMPVAQRWAYFDHAAVSPLPEPAREAIRGWVDEAAEAGDTAWPRWRKRIDQVRVAAAALIGARSDEVAFVSNTTTGICLVAEGFPWREGDNVVTLANEFPSNQYPWLNLAARGVQTRRVAARPDGRVDWPALEAACDGRTRIVALSWVGYASGYRLDPARAAELAHRRGALLLLDAIQALGVFPLDVHAAGVDFLAADGHKWLLGPEGAGLLFVARRHLDLLRPLGVGWNSVVHAHDYSRIQLELKPGADRYEGGSFNMVGVLGLGASIDLLRAFQVAPDRSPVADQVLAAAAEAAERLERIGARIASPRESDSERSGIVAFDLPGRDLAAVRRRCLDAGVVFSLRGGRLRISPHAYNDRQDLDRLIDALA